MKKIIGITLAVVLVYWVVETFMDSIVFHQGTFTERLLFPDPNELWMRLIVVTLMISFGTYARSAITRLKKAEERLIRMNTCFLAFGPNPGENINRLTALCGQLMGASAAFYNRLDRNMLYPWGRWNPYGAVPPPQKPQQCRHCHDVIDKGGDDVVVVRNLDNDPHASCPESGLVPCGLRTYVGKAVRLGWETVGSLCVVYSINYSLSEDDKRLMGIIASAIGVEEVRRRANDSLSQSEELLRHLSTELLTAEEAERKQLARLLHDSVGQSLSALKFGIEGALEDLDGEVDEQKLKPLRAAVPLIREIVNETRKIQKDLWPATLDDLGIIATINSFCKQYRDIYRNIRVETRIEVNEEDILRPLKAVIYRIMQEAMNNIAKHSGAEVALICLQKRDSFLEFVIQDDGSGFDTEEADSAFFKKGLGLSSMKERAELSGGSFTIDAEAGNGTTIAIRWPRTEHGLNP